MGQALVVEFEFVGNDGCDGVTGVAVVIDVLRAQDEDGLLTLRRS